MAENKTAADDTGTPRPQRPLPRPSALSAPFWAGARQHKLLLQRCGNCNAYRWTPQVLCTECFSEKYEWTEVSGLATVHSFTIVHRPPSPGFDAPYAVATVELKEGPLMLTNIVDCALDALAIGMPVRVRFEDASEEISLPKFVPA